MTFTGGLMPGISKIRIRLHRMKLAGVPGA